MVMTHLLWWWCVQEVCQAGAGGRVSVAGQRRRGRGTYSYEWPNTALSKCSNVNLIIILHVIGVRPTLKCNCNAYPESSISRIYAYAYTEVRRARDPQCGDVIVPSSLLRQVFDATNTTRSRRALIYDICTTKHSYKTFYVESLCTDKNIIDANITVRTTHPILYMCEYAAHGVLQDG